MRMNHRTPTKRFVYTILHYLLTHVCADLGSPHGNACTIMASTSTGPLILPLSCLNTKHALEKISSLSKIILYLSYSETPCIHHSFFSGSLVPTLPPLHLCHLPAKLELAHGTLRITILQVMLCSFIIQGNC
jgi:hypothetical protein